MKKLAHSAKIDTENPQNNVPEQSYEDHVRGVVERAIQCADEMFCYHSNKSYANLLKTWLILASEYHDLAKLIEESQKFLRGDDDYRDGKKMINHTDGGPAFLLREIKSIAQIVASLLIEGHHIGILEPDEEFDPEKTRCLDDWADPSWAIKQCRDNSLVVTRCPNLASKIAHPNETVREFIDRRVDQLLSDHVDSMGGNLELIIGQEHKGLPTPMEFRLLLSCLVEGDHYDTAKHYKNIIMQERFKYELQPNLRLKRLQDAIKKKQAENADENKERQQARNMLLQDCLNAPVNRGFYFCDATVGMGKTFSNSVLAMRIALHKNSRRFFWISPFNNITSQIAGLFRKILCLPNEDQDMSIAAHYHQAEYYKTTDGDWVQEKSKYNGAITKITNTLWESPIVVTTAVQFVETLASNKTGRLRKLNKVPGSVIVIDESDACVPTKLLRPLLKWLKILVEDFGCTVVFLSGTMFRFWETPEFSDILSEEPYCIVSEETRCLMEKVERKRISYKFLERPITIDSLCKIIVTSPGPRLVVMNTIVNACTVSWRLEGMIGKNNVEHISTAICPKVRKKTLKKVNKRLKRAKDGSEEDQNFVLVATSCIEAGVDLSFRSGFREKASVASVFQSGGRVNRECEYGHVEMIVFELCGNGITHNPQLDAARAACDEIARGGGRFSHMCATAARVEEMKISLEHIVPDKENVEKLEEEGNMHAVREHCKVIEGKTCAVVIDPVTKERLLNGEDVSYQEIEHASVQIYESKLNQDNFAVNLNMISAQELQEIRRQVNPELLPIKNDLMLWNGAYSDKYGYMEEFRESLLT